MKKYDYPELGEILWQCKLENGLTVAVVPRPGFTRKLAYFVTDFGAIHRNFTLDGEEFHVPAGIAHFLEHKMFDLPGGRDVSAELAALGASVNAFTSHDMTAYYFSCTERFEQCLALLLEFVSTPCFSEESVRKEIGIIDQEIGMDEDTPDSRCFRNLMEQMYQNHLIREDVLGDCDSIRRITPQMLYDCHRAFYTPGNMILCVMGDVEPELVEKMAQKMLGDQNRPVGQKIPTEPEPMSVTEADPVMEMEVSMPQFCLGFKCEPAPAGEEAIRQEVIGDLAAEALFGESSETYLKLYEAGLIDSSFGGGFETIDGMAMLLCSGDSDDPEAVRREILDRARIIAREGVAEGDFLRMKRSALGRRIRDLDSFDSTCFRICAYHLSKFDYFRFPAVYRDVEEREIQEFLDRVVRRERCGLSVIEPSKEEP